MKGHPFSVGEELLKDYYENSYMIKTLESTKPNLLRELDRYEIVWLLSPYNDKKSQI